MNKKDFYPGMMQQDADEFTGSIAGTTNNSDFYFTV
jgi:hypothetical protein